jgi:hypothetical protein
LTKRKHIEKLRKVAEEEGKYLCSYCIKFIPIEEMGKNIDGCLSSTCKKCKEIEKERNINRKNIYRRIQLEYIISQKSSCHKCKMIYIKPDNEVKYSQGLPTLEESGVRYVNYKGYSYSFEKFIELFSDLLEFRILDFDHLTEKEQRDRGLLIENDLYFGKEGTVFGKGCEKSMRKEAMKCQLLCAKCHLLETISREKGITPKTILNKKKREYVNILKLKIGGCRICKFFDVSLLRFLEFNHLKPSEKTESVTVMIGSDKYSLEDVINECKKCELLCRHCHRIETDIQRQQGLIKGNSKYYDIKHSLINEDIINNEN